MSKIKNLMANMSDKIEKLGKKFPLTMFLILCVTIVYTIVLDQDLSRNMSQMLEKFYTFCMIWGIGTFFTETWFVQKTHKIISYGITGAIGLIFTRLLTADMAQSTGEIEAILRFLFAYSLVLLLISVYKSMKNEDLKFQEYFLKVFRDLFHITTTYIILMIGITLVTSIFVQLIMDGHYGSILERLLVLTFGLFYVPSMVYTFSGISEKEVNSFIKGLVLYVLLPLTLISMVIIYLYIAKIILFRNMPKNTIYRILAGIFIFAFPVWNMASNYAQDKKFLGKIAKILPYMYAPFILLEIYSIGTRIGGFGLTPMRYVSCLFIVFQVISLVLTFYKKGEKISNLYWYTSVIVVIALVSPFHYENVSNWSQKGILEKTMGENTKFDELSEEEKRRVKGAYQYLKYQNNGEKFIPAYLTEEKAEIIEKYMTVNRENYEYPEYVSLKCELDLNIAEYTQITYVMGNGQSTENTVVGFYHTMQTLDLSDKVQEIISQNQNDDDFAGNNIVKISDKEDFYIARISFSYYKGSKEINHLYVEGYWLER